MVAEFLIALLLVQQSVPTPGTVPNCAPPARMRELLGRVYGEYPRVALLERDGVSVIETYRNLQTGSWTQVRTTPERRQHSSGARIPEISCIIAFGPDSVLNPEIKLPQGDDL